MFVTVYVYFLLYVGRADEDFWGFNRRILTDCVMRRDGECVSQDANHARHVLRAIGARL